MKRYFMLLFFTLLIIKATSQQDSIVVEVNGAQFVMIKIEGGTFHRGCSPKDESDKLCRKENQGEHTVTLHGFYIAKFEVTQQLYGSVMKKYPSHTKPQKSFGTSVLNPVDCVSWYDAQAFIDSLNKLTGKHFRLPTEAEWEYAARGGINQDMYKYAGSDNIDAVAWYHLLEKEYAPGYLYQWTKPVGGKYPNSLGIYDMTGNVAEWCSDWYNETYYQNKTNIKNPIGPEMGTMKICRGSGVTAHNEKCYEVNFRNKALPDIRSYFIGFRLAMDAE